MGRAPDATASCMRRTCTGEVWVRSSTVSGSPTSRYKVSHIPRAGCAGGILRASKLYQSVSISGPSATEKPIATNTSSSSSWVLATALTCPTVAGKVPLIGTSPRTRRSDSSCCARSITAMRSRDTEIAASAEARAACNAAPAGPRSCGSSWPTLRCNAAKGPDFDRSSFSMTTTSAELVAAVARSTN